MNFATLDSLYTPPIVYKHPSPFGECQHVVQNVGGTMTCIECGLETNSVIESNPLYYSMQKAYDPATRFYDLVESYCYLDRRVPDEIINQIKQVELTTKTLIRKWLSKNAVEYVDYSVEAYFKATDTQPFDLDPYARRTLVIDFERFLRYYYTRSNKSAPNLSFCFATLLNKYGYKYPESSISLPVSSRIRNQKMWDDFILFEHSK